MAARLLGDCVCMPSAFAAARHFSLGGEVHLRCPWRRGRWQPREQPPPVVRSWSLLRGFVLRRLPRFGLLDSAATSPVLIDALISALTVNKIRLGGLSGFRLWGSLRLEQAAGAHIHRAQHPAELLRW